MGAEFQASAATIDRLGDMAMRELAEHLWAVDCQSCGRPLGGRWPALVVNNMITSASASLHHRRCRRPRWNDTGSLALNTAELLSNFTRLVLAPFPATSGSEQPFEVRPMLVVNPSLEQVILRQDPDQRWRVGTVDLYSQFGLTRVSATLRELDLARPVAGARGQLAGEDLVVRVAMEDWSSPIEPAFAERVRELGGVVLAVTTMLHPGQLTDLESMRAAVLAGQVAMGWVAVDTGVRTGTVPSSEHLEQIVHPASERAPRGPVPDPVPYAGATYDPATGRFRLGVTADGTAHHWTLHTPGRGMEHGLVAGPAGSGRTNNLRLVLAEAIQAPHFTVMIADPRDRNGLCDTFAPIAEALARTVPDTVAMLQAAVRAVEGRLDVGGYTDPTPGHPALLVVIDDAEAVLADRHAADLAAQVVARGGPAGVGLVVATSTVDPADFAGRTDLLRGLAATNACPMSLEFFHFLQALQSDPG